MTDERKGECEVSDDLVTRLRKAVAQAEVAGVLPSWEFAKTTWEAADEIERLREQIKTLVHEWELSERGVHNEHKAVRGE